MDADKCRALLEVLESGSLSQAAVRLGYTPSGISRMIEALEASCGFPLLNRARGGKSVMTPTAECEALLPALRAFVHAGEALAQQADGVRGLESGGVGIGTSYRSYYPWLNRLITDFAARHPAIRINLQDGSSSELVRAVAEHRLDFCLVSRREGDFDWIPLVDNPLLAWLPASHPLAGAQCYPLKAFETDPFIETYPNKESDNSRVFLANGIRPNTRYTTSDTLATWSMVEAGLGVSCDNGLNAENLNGRVAVMPLDPPQNIAIGLAVPSLDTLSPAARIFLKEMRAHFPDKAGLRPTTTREEPA